MNTTVIYTHKGWFGLCPVYLAGLDSDGPNVDPRHLSLGWLMDLSEAVFGSYIYLRTMFNPAFEPMWPLVITDELATPIIRTHGDGGRT